MCRVVASFVPYEFGIFWLLIITPRLVLGEDQFGFRRGKGRRDAIGMLRIMSERSLDTGEELCACFKNWKETFDPVNWTKLTQILKTLISTGAKEN
jgi:hypothetical protein